MINKVKITQESINPDFQCPGLWNCCQGFQKKYSGNWKGPPVEQIINCIEIQ